MINRLDMTHNLYTFFLTNLILSPKLILCKMGLTHVHYKFKMHFSTLVPPLCTDRVFKFKSGFKYHFWPDQQGKKPIFFATVAIMNQFLFFLSIILSWNVKYETIACIYQINTYGIVRAWDKALMVIQTIIYLRINNTSKNQISC